MPYFLNKTFGSVELDVVQTVLDDWCRSRGLPVDSKDAELAGAILLNLMREGNLTELELRHAASEHKWLADDTAFHAAMTKHG